MKIITFNAFLLQFYSFYISFTRFKEIEMQLL